MLRRWPLLFPLVLSACVSAPPPHPRALECNELCAQYLGAGDLTRAEVQCDLGLQFSPHYADLWVNKGLIALRRGQTDTAKDHFIKALRYNQEQAQAYNNLGYIYYQAREYGKAHDNFQRALKVNPDYTEARYNLALAYRGMGEKDKAKKEFRTIIAVNPNLADPHHWLGVMAFEEGLLEEGIAELKQAVALAPDYAEAWMNLGNALAEAGRFAEAKDAFTSCLDSDPNNAPCRNGVALMHRKASLLDPALKEAEKASSDTNSPAALFALAREYRQKGLRNEEERTYRKCVRLEGRYAPCHFGLFEIYEQERRDKEAVIACKNFLKFAVAEEFPREAETCAKFLGANGQ